MIKKLCIALLVLVFALCNTACGAQKNRANNDFAISNGTETPNGGSGNALNDIPETAPENDIPSEADLLSESIKEAIVEANKGNYLSGEYHGVGYKIIETFEEDDILSVYALTAYVEYGFQDNVFVNISGTNPKVLMRFRITENNGYDLIFYTRLDLLSDLSEDELEELIRPLADTGNDYLYTEQDIQEVRAQADEEAAEYLRSIDRTADVAVRQSHEGQLLEEILSDESLLKELLKDDELSCYPNWLGTCERVENGERYIYKTTFDEERQEIIYTKIEYETNKIIETTCVDIQNGTISH